MSQNDLALTSNDEKKNPKSIPIIDLYRVLFSPHEAFTSIAKHSSWVLAFVLCIVVLIIFNIFTSTYRMGDLKERIKNDSTMSAQEIQRRVQNIENQKARGLTSYRLRIGAITLVLLQAAKLFGIAFAIWCAFKLFVLNGSFMKILSICSYAYIVLVPELIVKLFLILFTETANVFIGPAALLPYDMIYSRTSTLLAQFDIFNIWMVCLLIIGLPIVSNISKKQSAAIVLSLWGVWVILSTFFAGLIQIA